MREIINKTILVTGGANGIGRALVDKLSINNKVIVIDNTKTTIPFNKNVDFYEEDITNYENIKKIVSNVFEKYKNVDILINNAAIQTVSNIMNLSIDDFKKVLDVNLNANFYLTQLLSNKMQQGSTILNIISTHYDKPRIDKVHYDISKAGVSILTKTFALTLADKGITINAIAIGATYTNMNLDFSFDSKQEKETLEKIPLKHICTPEQIAQYVYDLINMFSTETTGSIFVVDGGRNINNV